MNFAIGIAAGAELERFEPPADWMTIRELEYCAARRSLDRVLGRRAGKEAVLKLLAETGTHVQHSEIEILPGVSGRPNVRVPARELDSAHPPIALSRFTVRS